MIRIAVCDDEKYFRELIRKLAGQYMEQYELLYEIDIFQSGEEFLALNLDIMKYSIIFLDINMDEIDGIKTAEKIREYSKDVFIVFVTAFIHYTLEGYKVNAIRYILKDTNTLEHTMAECIDTIIKEINYTAVKKKFLFNEGEREISLEKIIYIESILHRLHFHILEKEVKVYTLYNTLNSIESSIGENGFIRIHQSFLVNMKYIKNIYRYEALLINQLSLTIAKSRYKDVKDSFIAFKGDM